MITYIEVDCYEHNFKYGSDKNLLQRAYQKMVERELEDEEIDFHMLYDILLTNRDAKRFDNSIKGYDYDAIYLLDYKKEKDYKGTKNDILKIKLQDNKNNK